MMDRRVGTRTRERRHFAWSPQEDALLRSLLGRHEAEEIAAALNARFYTTRTRDSVTNRCRVLGLSWRRTDGIGIHDLRRIFPMRMDTLRREAASGALLASRRGTKRGSNWIFSTADIEAWIKASPWMFDWRRIAPGRWRDFVRAVNLRDPYLTSRECAASLGVSVSTVQKWISQGRIEGVVTARAACYGGYRIPLRALDQIERLAGRQEGAAA